MKKTSLLLSVAVAAGLLSGCASYNPQGIIYNGTTTGISANTNAVGNKMGKACSTSVLSLVATGDSSIAAAKANGKITNVSTIDYNVDNVLGIYGQYCTIVHGN